MTQVKSGDTVRVHYTGTLEDGSRFDSSVGGDPLEVTLGAGSLIPGFESALMGMAAGDSKTITIPSGEAYGAYDESRVQEVERARIPDEIELEIGRQLQAVVGDGQTLNMTVVAMSEETVTMDLNHPLAGEDLTFVLELVEIV